MRLLVLLLIAAAAHLSLTPFFPAPAGMAWLLWPFEDNSEPRLRFFGAIPKRPGSLIIPVLSAIAGVGFVVAAINLMGITFIPTWWATCVVAGAAASVLIYLAYFGRLALLPIAINALLLAGVLSGAWSLETLF
jgi:hypothetical protein